MPDARVTSAPQDLPAPPGAAAGSALRLAPAAVVAAAFVLVAAAGWGAFGDLLVDVGRELDVPRRLLAGERLYADVRWYYGPLAPWINTALYRVFGVRLEVLAAAGLVSAALMTALVHLLARRFTGRVAAAAAALGFVASGAFASDRACGFNICNFVLPYTFAATYGMICAAASLLFLVRHAQRGRAADFALSCAALAGAALAKLEPLAAALTAHAVFALAGLVERRLRPWPHLAGWGGAAAAVALVYGGLSLQVGPGLWAENLRALANPASEPFIRWSMGLDGAGVAVGLAARSAALLALAAAAAAAGAAVLAGRSASRGAALAASAAAGAFAFALFAWAGSEVAFRALPFVLLAAAAAAAWRWLRAGARRPERLPRVLLWGFGFVALGRILLRADLEVYGFYLFPVALVGLAVLVAEEVPALLGHHGARRTAWVLAAAGILCGAAVEPLRGSFAMFSERTLTVASRRGTLRLPPRQHGIAEVVTALERFPAGTRLLVVPDGAGMRFLAGLEATDPWSSHLPMELIDPRAEDALLRRLAAAPPDAVLAVERNVSEFGFKGFGIDYARRTGAFLAERYVPAGPIAAGAVLLVPARR